MNHRGIFPTRSARNWKCISRVLEPQKVIQTLPTGFSPFCLVIKCLTSGGGVGGKWHLNKCKVNKCKVTFDKASLKLAINFLLDQYFFSVGNSFFHQIIGIPMGLIYPPSWETSFFIVMKSGAFFLLRKKT